MNKPVTAPKNEANAKTGALSGIRAAYSEAKEFVKPMNDRVVAIFIGLSAFSLACAASPKEVPLLVRVGLGAFGLIAPACIGYVLSLPPERPNKTPCAESQGCGCCYND